MAYLRSLLLMPGSDFVLPVAARDADGDARQALTLLLLRDGLQQAVEDLWGGLVGEPRGDPAAEGGRLPLLVFLVENLLSLLFLSLQHAGEGKGTDRVRGCWC